MTVSRTALGVSLLGLALACGGLGEQDADVSSPQRFERGALAFTHPGNWTTETEVQSEFGFEIVTVSLTTPGDALVMVQSYPPGVAPGLDEATTIMVDTMTATITDETSGFAEMTPPQITSTQTPIAGADRDTRVVAYSLEVLGVQVPHHMHLYDVGNVLLVTNVADEDEARVQPGFQQVIDSIRVP